MPHTPLEQTCPAAHTDPTLLPWQLPLAPQKFGFVFGSMHVGVPCRLQSTRPCWQLVWHVPAEHTSPCGHFWPADPEPFVPHPAVAPQLEMLVLGSMHRPPHAISPVGQLMVHRPPEHA